MSRRRGWSLAELLVVSLLTAVVLLVVSFTLASTSRLTHLEAQRGFAQGHMQATLARIEHLLQRSCAAGVGWLAPTAGQFGVLAVHPQEAGNYLDLPHWEDHWSCLLWDTARSELWLRSCPPGPPAVTAPRTDRPQLPDASQLQQIATTSAARSQLLSRSVSFFDYRLEVGPIAHLILELQIAVPRKARPEPLRIERRLHFRNRI
jgi:hypothetical protein